MNFSEWKKSELGLIPDKWKVVSLSEIAEIVSGGTPSTKREEYYGNDVAWITPKDLSGYEKKYIGKGERSISNLGLKNSSARLLPKNTILFSSRAPIGYVAIAENELATNQGFKSLICDIEKVDIQFMYYKMKTLKNSLESVAGGSTFKEVSGKVVKKFKIKLPTLVEQISIGKILSSLDKKIELNNEMNKTLEEMAQALFKRWFVDFEFPNEEGKPYKSSGGEMVESELGMIPKGWRVTELDEVTELIIDHRGKTPKKLGGDWSESGYKAISAKNIKDGCIVNEDSIKYVDEELYNKWMKDKLKFGDILMTSEAPVGELYYITYDTEYCLSQRLYGIRACEKNMYPGILYYYMKSHMVREQILNRSTGTTVVGIRQSELRKVKVIVPENILQNKMNEILNVINNNLGNLQQENKNLLLIRDSLLPKLMSGEIRVSDIEANL